MDGKTSYSLMCYQYISHCQGKLSPSVFEIQYFSIQYPVEKTVYVIVSVSLK